MCACGSNPSVSKYFLNFKSVKALSFIYITTAVLFTAQEVPMKSEVFRKLNVKFAIANN